MLLWLQSRCSASSASRLACVKAAQRLVSVARRLRWPSFRICWFMLSRDFHCTPTQLPRWDVKFRMIFTTSPWVPFSGVLTLKYLIFIYWWQWLPRFLCCFCSMVACKQDYSLNEDLGLSEKKDLICVIWTLYLKIYYKLSFGMLCLPSCTNGSCQVIVHHKFRVRYNAVI